MRKSQGEGRTRGKKNLRQNNRCEDFVHVERLGVLPGTLDLLMIRNLQIRVSRRQLENRAWKNVFHGFHAVTRRLEVRIAACFEEGHEPLKNFHPLRILAEHRELQGYPIANDIDYMLVHLKLKMI